MLFKKNLDEKSANPKSKKFVKSILSILVLSSFVIGIAYGVKGISELSIDKILALASPVLSKAGINSDEIGEVAGTFISKVSDTNLKNDSANNSAIENIKDENDKRKLPILEVAIFADVHNSLSNLDKALEKVSELNIDQIICLGDLTDFGEEDTLLEIRKRFDQSAISYLCLPGDRDLYKSVGPKNYEETFGERYYISTLGGFNFMFFDNSANFTPVNETGMSFFSENISQIDFFITSQPLYHPVTSALTPTMGTVNGEIQNEVKQQADLLLNVLRVSEIKAVIAADHHHSSENLDPINADIKHIVVGALAEPDKRNLQTPRFSILTVYEDGSFEVKDIVL